MNNYKKWIKKWINNYIKNIDIEKIEWINLKAHELETFFHDNYLDKEVWQYIHDEKFDKLYPTLLGMNYLNYNNPINDQKYNYLLGVANNNIGKKTIIAATIYLDKYFVFTDQEVPVTYISTMEVNSYYRNRGIYKKMCHELINFINVNQHIITSMQSEMGLQYNVFIILKDILIMNGFEKQIIEDNYTLKQSELHDIICTNHKVLKK